MRKFNFFEYKSVSIRDIKSIKKLLQKVMKNPEIVNTIGHFIDDGGVVSQDLIYSAGETDKINRNIENISINEIIVAINERTILFIENVIAPKTVSKNTTNSLLHVSIHKFRSSLRSRVAIITFISCLTAV